jgi:2-hydroxycyclohexanecarboxyl-CoA dehydrogenase
MLAAGRGTIIAIASELGLIGCEGYAHYATGKGAVIAFVKALSLEVAHTDVRVNAVAPGPTDTPLIPEGSEWRDPGYVNGLPLRRLVDPLEIAGAVRFLADEGRYFNGEVLSPNAGAVI